MLSVNNDVNLKKIQEIYTPLKEAKKIIIARRKDKKFVEKVDEFIGEGLPKIFFQGPFAVLGRHLLSPNYELYHFIDRANTIGFKPLGIEYLQDAFVARNIDKYYLCNLFFFNGFGKKGDKKISAIKIIDFKNAEGKKLCNLCTKNGASLVDFHHSFLQHSNLDRRIKGIDLSEFLKIKGGEAKKYYTFYLSIFLYHGVLFENYLLDKNQLSFTEKIVVDSFYFLQEHFGVKPLIVPLGPKGDEDDLYWRFYNPQLKKFIDN